MIQTKTRTVYFSPRANRHFMTLSAAANKEASAMMECKYPREREEHSHYAAWHWGNDDKLRAIHARMKRRIISRFRRQRAAKP